MGQNGALLSFAFWSCCGRCAHDYLEFGPRLIYFLCRICALPPSAYASGVEHVSSYFFVLLLASKGPIPEQLGQLRALKIVFFSGNKFSSEWYIAKMRVAKVHPRL